MEQTVELTINEIKKDLYKSKSDAKFSFYSNGNLYYNVFVLGALYQFPISTVEEVRVIAKGVQVDTLSLSSDLGTTAFNKEIKASDLIRWITKAFEKNEFIKISL